MTYFYAGLVQGESGGRAISNEDFKAIYDALWSTVGGKFTEGSLEILKKTINKLQLKS